MGQIYLLDNPLHREPLSAETARGLSFLDIRIDNDRNQTATGERDRDLTAHVATVNAVVVTPREDVEIARQVRRVLAGPLVIR